MLNSEELKIILKAKDNASAAFKNFSTNVNRAKQDVKKYGKEMDLLKSRTDKLGKIGMLALAGGVTKSITSFANFEKRMSNISTLIDTSKESMKSMSDNVLKLGKKMPVPINDLAEALYDVRSAGISADIAMATLKSSAKLATAGLSSTKEATNIMTSAVNTFAFEGLKSEKIADILFKTVKAGKTTVAELSQSFGASAPIIATAGIKLEDFQAATAALTTTGLPASQAQMGLRQAIASLLKPTGDMSALFQKLGVKDGKQLIETSQNMRDVFIKLQNAAGGNNETFAKAIGRLEGLNAITGIVDTSSQAYTDTLQSMYDDTNLLDGAYKKQTKTLSNQWQLTKNEFIPILINLGDYINKHIIPIIKNTIDWFQEHSEVTKILAGTVSGLVIAFGLLKTAMMIKETVLGLAGAFKVMNSFITIATGAQGVGGLTAALGTFASVAAAGGAVVLAIYLLQREYSHLQQDVANLNTSIEGLSKMMDIAKEKMNSAADEETRKKWENLYNEMAQTREEAEKLSKIDLRNLAGGFRSKMRNWLGFSSEGGLNLFGLASGGPVESGHPYIVGEKGPELFIPNQSGSIQPNQTLNNNVTINFGGVSVRSDRDINSIAEAIQNVMARRNILAQKGII